MIFDVLGQATQPIALRLSLMCQQTEWRMLTGVVTTIRAINGFHDFSWQDLFSYIHVWTGTDEAAVVHKFAEYINPEAGAAAPDEDQAGGHWAGWEFALRTKPQNNLRNPKFINVLYAAVQLFIQAGGNLTLRGYAALDNAAVPGRLVIDAWIAAYIAGGGLGQNPYPTDRKTEDATLQTIRRHAI